MNQEQIIERFSNLNVGRSSGQRAPHKPLLLLVVIAKFQEGKTILSFDEIEEALSPLLATYAPPVKKPDPKLPYWHLQSDQLWEIEGAEALPRQMGGFPKMAGLRRSSARLPESVIQCLRSDPALIEKIVKILLFEHFPESLHEDILATVGLSFSSGFNSKEAEGTYTTTKKRDPKFRENVLRAYEHQCALTGFRAALAGNFFACEAAHVQWHAFDGPDSVDNGLCLEPTMHKLFDAGAWSLSDDRRVLVSANFTGSDFAIQRLRTLHGQSIRSPLAGHPEVSPEYIRWHRERQLGGVFREPALPL
ncbi:MAG: phosphorothioated DNA-binding restriction endonuclease [Cyanobacteria bacterium P01_A01_bin.114]